MSKGKMITLYKNNKVELILNQRKNQIALLDCGLSEVIRNADDYDYLKNICGIDGSNSLAFDNTYRYLLINDYVLFNTNDRFNKKVFQWQDKAINVVTKANDILNSQKKILSDNLFVNEFIVFFDDNTNVENFTFESISEINTISRKVTVWILLNAKNLDMRMKWIFEHYNNFDEIVIIIEEELDLQILNNCLFKDTNNKVSYQLFIPDFLQYKNMWIFFYELGYITYFSSRLFCLCSEMSSTQSNETKLAINVMKNSVYCLLAVNESEEVASEIILPGTINCTIQDYLYNSITSDIYRPIRNNAQNDCCFNMICPYQCTGCDCEYKSMMADLIGIDL